MSQKKVEFRNKFRKEVSDMNKNIKQAETSVKISDEKFKKRPKHERMEPYKRDKKSWR